MRVDRSDVVSFVALFVALGGSGIAAIGEFRRGSVTTSALKNGAVIETKIADGAVSRRALHPGAVSPQHLATGAVTHRSIEPGGVWWDSLSEEVRGFVSTGARPAADRVAQYVTDLKLVSSGSKDFSIRCPQPGEIAVGGGFSAPANTALTASFRGKDKDAWFLTLTTTGTASDLGKGYVVCLT